MKELLKDPPESVTSNGQSDAVQKQRYTDLRDVRVLGIAELPEAVYEGEN